MKATLKAITISSVAIFMIVGLIALWSLFYSTSWQFIISIFLLLGVIFIYLVINWFIIKNSKMNEEAGSLVVFFNSITNLLVIVGIFLFGSFLMSPLQDMLFYNLGISIRYIQSPLFVVLFPALLFCGLGIAMHIVMAKKSQIKKSY